MVEEKLQPEVNEGQEGPCLLEGDEPPYERLLQPGAVEEPCGQTEVPVPGEPARPGSKVKARAAPERRMTAPAGHEQGCAGYIIKTLVFPCALCLVSRPLWCYYVHLYQLFSTCFHFPSSPPMCILSVRFHSFLICFSGLYPCLAIFPGL